MRNKTATSCYRKKPRQGEVFFCPESYGFICALDLSIACNYLKQKTHLLAEVGSMNLYTVKKSL